MNLARIHDKYKTKKFWEQKIENHCQMTSNEELRMKNSALSKLRNEWIQRLESRTRQQSSFNENLRATGADNLKIP
ncbi:protein FAM240A [Scleropages formosus]|uniref:protein FAM240A n=1 Tax=Scleropages formosus TaxID=113540 RepID=UPI0008782513|nr:protein FAM240A [Scleropages formosus]